MPFSAFAPRLAEVRARIDEAIRRGGHGQQVRIVAVTKTYGPDAVDAAWQAGVGDVGENKVQEALEKQAAVAAGFATAASARWHLIGHLQRNKVKALDHFVLFHALDSARLANAVHEHGVKRGRPVDVLVQVNVVGEQTKGGFSPSDMEREGARLRDLAGVRVAGVMTMAPFDADPSTLRRVFAGARAVRDLLVKAGHEAKELSMGMSGDYEVAVEEGATIARLGTVLFGVRTP